ncbi:helix-turn-helix domain-containing protein [Butyricicoccus pullicaecorum]|uniref:HTH araC/xylS-type domain-containing protein n=1 Tax=Butyricicoccus pullicaecorum 1.2 TaxID=1203606 RepID=R8WDP8_9FIRM|nr:helix-turn-helix domain-containing protein [Butyricicoccus pullicaecorum]EOQ41307.1 hypothetical protein HMPREF1526_00021 [Butyricicoccus pullicaecorum 1.2]SKA62369.1 AraC-type DNA-binding protein [Butyricicoccus pullicaecorum DSM 23266]
MDFQQQCLHYCNFVQTLTGTHCTLIRIPDGSFCSEPFRTVCDNYQCNASHTHLYGAYEAERWDGKYIYYCPRGLVFIATMVHDPDNQGDLCMITGPIVMANSLDDPYEDNILSLENVEGIPRMTTQQTRALSELLRAAVGYLSQEDRAPNVDSGRQAQLLNTMYDLYSSAEAAEYPIDSERQLQQSIRAGDKEGSQRLLNVLLSGLYLACGNDLAKIKQHVHSLLVLMSRAAIDGGADVNDIFRLSQSYEPEIEKLRNLEELNRWLSMVLHRFINFVFDFNDIKHHNVIYQTTAYIKENLAEKLTLEDAAEHVSLSKSYFCRVLKDELGYTFTEYVNHLRVERAKLYLRDSTMSIADIAYAVGFDDQSYFTRIFKKLTNVSPGQYRKSKK